MIYLRGFNCGVVKKKQKKIKFLLGGVGKKIHYTNTPYNLIQEKWQQKT